MTVYYITHPQIRIDPAVPVPDWGLSDLGRQRAEAMLWQPWIPHIARVIASAERKSDQPAGGGNYFAFDPATRRLLHRWKAIDVVNDDASR
jgi:hypothetical protein